MARRPCAEPGCPTITDHTRCQLHERARDHARGRRQARGYDRHYDRAVQAIRHAQPSRCVTCDQPFTADNPMTGGHRVALRDGGTNSHGIDPQCRKCNYGWRRTGV